jgi:uncharacterized membrane protein
MAQLIVITFPDMKQAVDAYETLKRGEHSGYISMNDIAVIVKDEEGKVDVNNRVESGVKQGALWGGLLGLLIGTVFFPIGGLLLGAAGGALVGKTLHTGIDQKFVKDVTDDLKPGTSALFLLVHGANTDYAIAAMRPFAGTLYQTTLSSEAEATLRDALKPGD